MSCTSGGGKSVVPEQFPSGLRVLLVDDDLVCLRVLEQMLRKCMYNVTSCSQAKVALNLLRERKGGFDIVLSDVHMPDMDGFKLLELVGLEMDLPVIMMSADGRTNLVMRGIRHGACDYLIKPIRDEAVKNIWQHVVRKKWKESKENDTSDTDFEKRAIADAENDASSVNEGADGVLKSQKKRRNTKDEDDKELENDDPTMAKKPRVVWSLELHQQFVSAVNQVGIDKAVPKRILELMNVPGLTRENVASHLQKFRLYLKRLSVVAQLQGGLPANSYCGQVQQIQQQQASLGRFDIQAMAASGHLPPQTLTAALQAEILSRPEGNLLLPAMDQSSLLYASLPVDRNVAYGQPQIKCSSNIMSNEDIHSATFGTWTSKNPRDMCNLENVVETDTSMLMSRMPNVQPSCVVLPSQQSPSFQGSYNPRVLDQGQISNDVYIGKGTSIPSRFAVDEEEELQMSNINRSKFFAENNGNKVKQEPTMESLKVGPRHFSSNDLMSVFSD